MGTLPCSEHQSNIFQLTISSTVQRPTRPDMLFGFITIIEKGLTLVQALGSRGDRSLLIG